MYRFTKFLVIFLGLKSVVLVLAQTKDVHIVVTTDVHGHYFPYDFVSQAKGKSSLSKVHYLVDSLRHLAEGPVVLLDNGDFMQGTPAAYHGAYISGHGDMMIDILQFMNYDAMTVGNHDIECGPKVYRNVQSRWEGALLGANVIDTRTGNPYFKPYTILHKEGLRIAVLGLTTPGVPNWLPSSSWEFMEFGDLVSSAAYWSEIIKEREKPDLLVGLFHSGLGTKDPSSWTPMAENAAYAIAATVPGFDLIFTGHDHGSRILKVPNVSGDSVLIIGGGSRCQEMAHVRVSLNKASGHGLPNIAAHANLISLSAVQESRSYNERFTHEIAGIQSWSTEPVCHLESKIAFIDALKGSSAGMDLIHQVQLAETNADISIAAPLSFNDTLQIGPLLNKDFFSLYIYENYLYSVSLKGSEILNYLEYSYGMWLEDHIKQTGSLLAFKRDSEGQIRTDLPASYRLKVPFFNLDAAAGIVYTVHIDSTQGNRIEIKSLANGKPFSTDSYYTVAMNSYRGSGGGGHLTKGAGISPDEIQDRIISMSRQEIRTLLMNYYKAQKKVSIPPLSQWQFSPDSIAKELLLHDIQLLLD